VRTWSHGNSYHLRKAPDALRTKPADLDWAHYLGRLKWRDWDPQQYWNWRAYHWNWRAYLDFGGGQVTDLFTHWIEWCTCSWGRTPVATSAIGGVFNYRGGRTAPDTINVLLEYPAPTSTFEATLVPGITGRHRVRGD
jgi:predicted dehydrogenase